MTAHSWASLKLFHCWGITSYCAQKLSSQMKSRFSVYESTGTVLFLNNSQLFFKIFIQNLDSSAIIKSMELPNSRIAEKFIVFGAFGSQAGRKQHELWHCLSAAVHVSGNHLPSDSRGGGRRTAVLLNCLTVAVSTVSTHTLVQSPHFLAPADHDTTAACLLSELIFSLVMFSGINAFRETSNPSQTETVIQSKRLIHLFYIVLWISWTCALSLTV